MCVKKSVCPSLKTLLTALPASIALFLIAPDFHDGIHEFPWLSHRVTLNLLAREAVNFALILGLDPEVLRQRMELGYG